MYFLSYLGDIIFRLNSLPVKTMPVFFLAPYPLFGRKNDPKPISYQHRSPYYWWWAYLKRNSAYLDCCERGGTGRLAKLYADFGDVRLDDFKKWWSEGRRGVVLFGEGRLQVKFGVLNSVEDWKTTWSKEKVMVVAVPLDINKRILKRSFNELLDARHDGKQGRRALADTESTSRYPLARNYTIQNLQTALDVYDQWVANEAKPKEERIKQWEIGVVLKLNAKAVKDANSKLTQDRLIGRNVLGATVKRYLTQAQAIIKNVEKGVFPVSS